MLRVSRGGVERVALGFGRLARLSELLRWLEAAVEQLRFQDALTVPSCCLGPCNRLYRFVGNILA
jgi:hypothetical protein